MKATPDIVKNYRGLALRTLSAASFLDKDPELYCTTNQLHAAIGLVTEIQEIKTDASKQEEISDSSWFLNLAADSVDADFAAMVHEATINVRRNLLATSSLAADGQMDKLNRAAIHLLDCAKASIYYGRKEHKNFLPKGEKLSWRDTVLNDVKSAAEAVAYLCVIWKIDIYETLEKNIAKLALRYPEKFDTNKASNRDVKSELEVFKSKVKAVIAAETRKGGIIDKKPQEGEDKLIVINETMSPEVAAAFDNSTVDYTITDEHVAEINSHPTDCANPAELTEDSVVIEEIPREDIPADIQEKMDEVGAAMGEFIAEKHPDTESLGTFESVPEMLTALGHEELAKEVEFSAEALVESVEETAEQVKADKKKPGRKKNN